ncbi:MAG: Protein of unknown function (DUF1553)/Protein of unknown function (DUF1549)/Planctomycete [Planctomycetaceae bacterium]|nr:Protein of unknown function (DUF1553)/Protein of unknown function (DUF1549)/Planctomycete [Planctomycetaceae bacterium]
MKTWQLQTLSLGKARFRPWPVALGLVAAFVALVAGRPAALAAEERVSFNRDIRPILSDACFRCHGPDDQQRKGGLRLDVRASAIKPSESGDTAIVPGKIAASELIARITSAEESVMMPPRKTGKTLTPAQIALLKRWIEEGAEYQGHWAFITPQRPPVPELPGMPPASVNPIDAFVRTRLKLDGLQPSAQADKYTLIRRVSLDLTGIPPTPQEVDAFLADETPEAYERVVERLLASPRYGERMAMQWLDFARYADSNGFQVDSSRYQWPWRNWVIQSFNANLPFDQFTVQQIAGDMLPNATPDQIVATGFNRNHKLNGEGGIIAEEWRVETVIDRVETTGLTWLGLTLNCCRCHDHKYDPITQKEFYQFFAFFNNVPESGTLQGETRNTDPTVAVATPERSAELARLAAAIPAAEARLADSVKQLPQLIAAWEPKFREQISSNEAIWRGLAPREVKSAGGAVLTRQEDGSYLASGPNPNNDVYEIVAPVAAGTFSGLLLECFVDPQLPQMSLGRFSNGNFVLSRVDAEITAPSLKEPLKAVFQRAEADYSQSGWDIKLVLDDNPANGWAVDGPTKKESRKAMFLVAAPLTIPADATLTVRLRQEALTGHNIGRFRLSTTSHPPAAVTLMGTQYPETLRQTLATESSKRSPQQVAELEKYFRANVDSPVKQAETAIAKAKQDQAAFLAQMPTVMVMREGPPRDAFVLIRGEYEKHGDKVAAGLPAAFPPLPAGAAMNRLGLARWIADPSNPLTARVWVNRAWERFFGTGLVKTSENLGSQSEFPSHPALLDWLAVEFMQPVASPKINGQPAVPWDMKALQKLIVLSATYRQSSHVTPQMVERDPENRLLARGPRFRNSAEMLRDQALAVSGLLVEKLGGPSVRPYMPTGVWDDTSRYGDLRNYQNDQGEGLYRRTMYTVWKRTAAPPTMMLFDSPSREICTVKRSRTNTPLQALSLLNEVTFIEAARKLGERMLLEGGATVGSRLEFGFRLVTSRRPTDREQKILTEAIAADVAHFQKHPDAAARLVTVGLSKSKAGINTEELAAYTLAANVLLNLDEFVMRE